jgi:Flp pilus assembly protein TadD
MRLDEGDRAGALSAFEESLLIMRRLAAADPGNGGLQRDVSVSLNDIGNVRRAAGNRTGALAAYEESLSIMRKLAASDPHNARWQTDLVVSLYKINAVSDPPVARVSLREALGILEALARVGKLTAAQQNWPQSFRDELAKLPPEGAEAQ